MKLRQTRRDFVKLSAAGFGSAVFSIGLAGCDDKLSRGITFGHGIASGDPLHDRVILWTRVTPNLNLEQTYRIGFQVAVDAGFKNIINSGSVETGAERDFTIKVDAAGLEPDTTYYYRFLSRDQVTKTGKTKTLSIESDQVKFAIVSCSNYPAGYFHVYNEIAQQTLDAVLHLGDYIYEYGNGSYGKPRIKSHGNQNAVSHYHLILIKFFCKVAYFA